LRRGSALLRVDFRRSFFDCAMRSQRHTDKNFLELMFNRKSGNSD